MSGGCESSERRVCSTQREIRLGKRLFLAEALALGCVKIAIALLEAAAIIAAPALAKAAPGFA